MKNCDKKITKNHYPVLSNFYSYLEVDKLRQKYENDNQITYDCVIHTRFDISIDLHKDLREYDMSKFYAIDQKDIFNSGGIQ